MPSHILGAACISRKLNGGPCCGVRVCLVGILSLPCHGLGKFDRVSPLFGLQPHLWQDSLHVNWTPHVIDSAKCGKTISNVAKCGANLKLSHEKCFHWRGQGEATTRATTPLPRRRPHHHLRLKLPLLCSDGCASPKHLGSSPRGRGRSIYEDTSFSISMAPPKKELA